MQMRIKKIVGLILFGFGFINGMSLENVLRLPETYFNLLPRDVTDFYILRYCRHNERIALFSSQNPRQRTSWLYSAAQVGNRDDVEFLLDQGLNKDELSATVTPLCRAAESGHISVVQLLLAKGADVKLASPRCSLPLIRATANRHHEIVKLLLVAGAPVESIDWECETPLFIAASGNDVQMADFLLQNGAKKEQECHYERALGAAASRGHLDVVRLLLSRGAFKEWTQKQNFAMNWRVNYGGLTPLCAAALNGKNGAVRELITHGASKNRLCRGDKDLKPDANERFLGTMTPLLAAVRGGHCEVVRTLLEEGAAPDKPNAAGITPLREAVARNNRELARLLILAGADKSRPTKEGLLLFECARLEADGEMVTLLQEDMGELPPCCFHNCCWHKHQTSPDAKTLFDGLTINVDECWIYGAKPLFVAARNGHGTLVRQLIERGADPTEPYMGITPLYAAIEGGHEGVALLLIEQSESINVQCRGCSPLFAAIEYNRENIAVALMNKGAQCVSIEPAFRGATVLYCAAFFGHQSLVKRCLERSPNRDDIARAILIATENGNVRGQDDRYDVITCMSEYANEI